MHQRSENVQHNQAPERTRAGSDSGPRSAGERFHSEAHEIMRSQSREGLQKHGNSQHELSRMGFPEVSIGDHGHKPESSKGHNAANRSDTQQESRGGHRRA